MTYLAHDSLDPFLPAQFRVGDARPNGAWRPTAGMDVWVETWPAEHPRAHMVLLHGAGGHARLLAPLARMAQRLGATVWAPDLPGYGRTRLSNPTALRYDHWRAVAGELLTASAASGMPTIVFGLSMGAMLAYDAAARTHAAAALMATCFLDPSNPVVRAGMARWPILGGLTGPLLHAAPFLTDRLRLPMALVAKMKGIANDPLLVRQIIRDPSAGGNSVPLGFLRTFLDHQPALAPQEFRLCPVTLVHPGDDRWTAPILSQPFFNALACEKRFVLLENAGHCPVEAPGVHQLADAMADTIARAVSHREAP